jgi:hypothetical protein
MLTLKASVATAMLAGTALVSAGAGYAVSQATMTAQVSVTCPTPAAALVLPHSLPPGPVPELNAGKKW